MIGIAIGIKAMPAPSAAALPPVGTMFPRRRRRKQLKANARENNSADDTDHAEGDTKDVEKERPEQQEEQHQSQGVKTRPSGDAAVHVTALPL